MDFEFIKFMRSAGSTGTGFLANLLGLGRKKCSPLIYDLDVTLEDLYKGKTMKIQYEKSVVCKECKGKNCVTQKCTKCDGEGKLIEVFMEETVIVRQTTETCDGCNGKGSIIADRDLCSTCFGDQTIAVEDFVELVIPPAMKRLTGMPDGVARVFGDKGDEEPGMAAGDVVVKLHCKAHPIFGRHGEHLLLTKEITFAEALCGTMIVVEHLDGRKLAIQTEVCKVIPQGGIQVIKGEGMPIFGKKERGNLYIACFFKCPTDFYLNGDTLYKEFEEGLPEKPITHPRGKEVSLHVFDKAKYEKSDRREETPDESFDPNMCPLQ